MSTIELITATIQELPPEKQQEVLDFVQFLRGRVEDAELASAAAILSEPALRGVWDNPQDDVYNDL